VVSTLAGRPRFFGVFANTTRRYQRLHVSVRKPDHIPGGTGRVLSRRGRERAAVVVYSVPRLEVTEVVLAGVHDNVVCSVTYQCPELQSQLELVSPWP
jgi:hypothetical protein